jgi:hypothetical protein
MAHFVAHLVVPLSENWAGFDKVRDKVDDKVCKGLRYNSSIASP